MNDDIPHEKNGGLYTLERRIRRINSDIAILQQQWTRERMGRDYELIARYFFIPLEKINRSITTMRHRALSIKDTYEAMNLRLDEKRENASYYDT